MVRGCGYICASEKRMKMHWGEGHGGVGGAGEGLGRRIKMQTFFRGTKVRYFEVEGEKTVGMEEEGSDLVLGTEGYEIGEQEKGHEGQRVAGGAQELPCTSVQNIAVLQQHDFDEPPTEVNLDTLAYFNHYTMTTCLMLPVVDSQRPANQYWRVEAVRLALQNHRLMCGLLALAAYHMAAQADTQSTGNKYALQADRLFAAFCSHEHRPARPDLDGFILTARIEFSQEIAACRERLELLLQLVRWKSHQGPETCTTSGSESTRKSRLHTFLTLMRGLTSSTYAQEHRHLSEGQHQERDDSDAELDQNMTYSHDTRQPFSTTDASSIDRLRHSLLTLPPRMVSAFGRPPPDQVPDVLAIVSAIASLLTCCETNSSTAVNGIAEAAWQRIASWPHTVSDHFLNMVASGSTAAVVVCVHWVVLVEQACKLGYWFLEDVVFDAEAEIEERLSHEGYDVRALIEGLRS